MSTQWSLREQLVTLLRRWQRGELLPLDVLVAAERLWESDPLVGQPQAPVFPRSDPRAIDYHVLWLMEVLHCDPLLPVDIPAILAFLETPPGQEAEAWRRWEAYWAAIDWEARLQAVGDLNSYLQTGQLVPRGAMEPVLAAAATCVAIGPYDDALTYGARYPVLAANDEGDRPKLKIRNDRGRVRWYPQSCFDLSGAPAPQIATVRLLDTRDQASQNVIAVEILFSTSEWRWCVCTCPEALPHFGDVVPGTKTRLHAMPHLIILTELTEERIRQALQFLLEQGRLLEHTRSFMPSERSSVAEKLRR